MLNTKEQKILSQTPEKNLTQMITSGICATKGCLSGLWSKTLIQLTTCVKQLFA